MGTSDTVNVTRKPNPEATTARVNSIEGRSSTTKPKVSVNPSGSPRFKVGSALRSRISAISNNAVNGLIGMIAGNGNIAKKLAMSSVAKDSYIEVSFF